MTVLQHVFLTLLLYAHARLITTVAGKNAVLITFGFKIASRLIKCLYLQPWMNYLIHSIYRTSYE